MKSVFVDEDGQVRIRDVPQKKVCNGQLGIRSVCSLISPGTELHYISEAKKTRESFPLGYCTSGYVEQIASQTEGFSIGDRVIAMGWGYAVHAEYVCVPYRLCVKIPDQISFDDAVFANLVATAIHAIHRAGQVFGERVLIVGAGLVGQLVAQCCKTNAADIYIVDLLSSRLNVAQTSGIQNVFNTLDDRWVSSVLRATSSKGINKVFLCINGDGTSILNESIKTLTITPDGHRRGIVICVGRFNAQIYFNVEMGNIDIRYSARCGGGYRDDDYVHGRRNYPPQSGESSVDNNLRAALQLIHNGKIELAAIHTHRIDFKEAPAAYDLFKNPEYAIGVTLHYQI
ncbi:zinc-binding alcohol dehydrogenase [Nostoc sp. CHAB 5824]|nr:zinc-binding alcohol dehydrogenase [Nostoc sp. CHAB 5824]